jgi:hypothetical protein
MNTTFIAIAAAYLVLIALVLLTFHSVRDRNMAEAEMFSTEE